MIYIDYIGRLGNNIFQYVIGRILAERLNFGIISSEIIDSLPNINGLKYNEPVIQYKNHTIDIEKIVNDSTARKIHLCGYFQRYEYFRDKKELIRSWIKFPQYNQQYPQNNDLVIHLRIGDVFDGPYHEAYAPTPYCYYKSIIENESFKKLYILCGGSFKQTFNNPLVDKITKNFGGTIIHNNNMYQDFDFLLHSNKLAMSFSTFAWWGAWLSNAEKIHFPIFGMWHPKTIWKNNNDLYVNNEPRYIYHELYPVNNWKCTPEQLKCVLSDRCQPIL